MGVSGGCQMGILEAADPLLYDADWAILSASGTGNMNLVATIWLNQTTFADQLAQLALWHQITFSDVYANGSTPTGNTITRDVFSITTDNVPGYTKLLLYNLGGSNFTFQDGYMYDICFPAFSGTSASSGTSGSRGSVGSSGSSGSAGTSASSSSSGSSGSVGSSGSSENKLTKFPLRYLNTAWVVLST